MSDPPSPWLPQIPFVLPSSLIEGRGAAPPRRHALPPLLFPLSRLPTFLASRTPHRLWGASPSHDPPSSSQSAAADAGACTHPLGFTQQSFNSSEEGASSTLGDHFSFMGVPSEGATVYRDSPSPHLCGLPFEIEEDTPADAIAGGTTFPSSIIQLDASALAKRATALPSQRLNADIPQPSSRYSEKLSD